MFNDFIRYLRRLAGVCAVAVWRCIDRMPSLQRLHSAGVTVEEAAAIEKKLNKAAGRFPAFAWPSGYPIFYILADGLALCPKCANGENGSEATAAHVDQSWRIVASEINYEDMNLSCDNCNCTIECVYPEGSGQTVTDAEKDAGSKIQKALSGSYP
jgi:hypothetical protein